MTRIAQNHPAFPQWLKISQAISAHRKEMRRLKAEREDLVSSAGQRAKAAIRAERRPESHGSGPRSGAAAATGPAPMSHKGRNGHGPAKADGVDGAQAGAGKPLSIGSRILGFLLDNQGQAFTPSEVAQGVGLPATREVRSTLKKLVRQARVTKADKRHYAI